jgi:hypothetical protein
MGSLFTIIEVMHGFIFAYIMWFVHHKKLYIYASIYNIYIYNVGPTSYKLVYNPI